MAERGKAARAHGKSTARASAAPRTSRTRAAQWLLAAISTCIALVLCEVFVRAFDLGPNTNVVFRSNFRLSDDPLLRYELVPGSADGSAQISAAGLRDREYATPKPAGTFRILLIGDSIAYGFGTARGDTLPSQLAALLQSARANLGGMPRFEVLNLGVPGYNIEQVAENARVRGLAFEPDVIVYAYCLNDPQADSFELASLEHELSPARLAYRAATRRAQPPLLDRSRLVLLARYALHALGGGERPAAVTDAQWVALRSGDYTGYFERLYQQPQATLRVQRGIDALQQLAQHAKAPLVVAIFPLFTDLDAYRLGALHQQTVARFGARNITTYDLLPLYVAAQRAYGPVFVFNALHPNMLGHRIAALYLARALAQGGQLGDAARRLDLNAATAHSKVDQAFLRLIEQSDAGAGP